MMINQCAQALPKGFYNAHTDHPNLLHNDASSSGLAIGHGPTASSGPKKEKTETGSQHITAPPGATETSQDHRNIPRFINEIHISFMVEKLVKTSQDQRVTRHHKTNPDPWCLPLTTAG